LLTGARRLAEPPAWCTGGRGSRSGGAARTGGRSRSRRAPSAFLLSRIPAQFRFARPGPARRSRCPPVRSPRRRGQRAVPTRRQSARRLRAGSGATGPPHDLHTAQKRTARRPALLNSTSRAGSHGGHNAREPSFRQARSSASRARASRSRIHYQTGPGELPARGVQEIARTLERISPLKAGSALLSSSMKASDQAPSMPDDVATRIGTALAAEAARR
jgi:hypothetical protein